VTANGGVAVVPLAFRLEAEQIEGRERKRGVVGGGQPRSEFSPSGRETSRRQGLDENQVHARRHHGGVDPS
jgi:hypothetical protein